jgi:hypothetical protein
MDVNTRVRDHVAALERAAAEPELIVDQRLLDRMTSLVQTFAQLRQQGPQRLRQARSAKRRTPRSSATRRDVS